jgi:hypothetical protein
LLESDANIMNELVDLGRRETIKVTTGLLTGLVIAGSHLSFIARGPAWAVDLSTLTTSEGVTLMAVARTIAPHDKLDVAAYALVVQALDADAAKEEKNRAILKDAIVKLGPGFAATPESARIEALKKIESSQFFQAMRLKTLQVLYSSPIAYSYFGYEGEAFSKGGYLHRGFNDLRWLPGVPSADSGPMPT